MEFESTLEKDFVFQKPFELVSGEVLPTVKLRYAIYGELNERRDNAVLVFHALTGSARINDWWRDLIGAGCALNTETSAFICANYLGSCYGSTREINTLVTTRDIVLSQVKLLEHLKIEKLKAVVGGSLGGQLALQLAIDFPELAEKCIAIGACELSALGLALNHLQREAIRQTNDVSLARQIAMISYKSPELFEAEFARRPNRTGENPFASLPERFDVAGYLDYQGAKFQARFDYRSYLLIAKAMDLFEINENDIIRLRAEITLIGISSDWLFPSRDVRKLARKMSENGVTNQYIEMDSPDGHDAFLSDTRQMSKILREIFATK